MTEQNPGHTDLINRLILGWFVLLVLGPYIPNPIVPIRIDHVLFPVAGTAIYLWMGFRFRSILIPWVLLPLAVFFIIAFFSTFNALNNPFFYISKIGIISALESHLRIFLTFILAFICAKMTRFDWSFLLTGLFWISVVAAVFGISQLISYPDWLDRLPEKIAADWYSGRHDREKSVVELCVHWRAVSTFYHPGNYSLYSALIIPFLLVCREKIKVSALSYWCGLFLITLGWSITMSKGFVLGMGLIFIYLIIFRYWKISGRYCLVIFISLLFTYPMSPDSIKSYQRYVIPGGITSLYNRFFSSRYGEVTYSAPARAEAVKPDATREKPVKTDDDVPPVEAKNDNKDSTITLNSGYLSSAYSIIRRYWLAGVGYVSNAPYGDSMLIHLMIRGGFIGSLSFIIFVFACCFILVRKKKVLSREQLALNNTWIFSAVLFIVWGFGFPTFIQDRTSDIFWWTGALLAFEKLPDTSLNKSL